ncbi:MAG: acyltransferase family protein [Acidimicrobiales bacterium]
MATQDAPIAPEISGTPVTTHAASWRPGLDGLRAVAVLGVMAYHEPNFELSGGFLGVDLFFVLSGFLITGLLLDERLRSGTVSLRSFWNRRARRLLPALAAFLLAVVVATTLIGDVAQRRDLPSGVLSAIFYVSNWNLIASQQSYFDQFTSPSPLEHLWSLAIEEQFYLIWPLVVLACLAHSRRLLIGVTVLATVTSIGLMFFFLGEGDPSRSYFGTDTRAFSLLIGALGALFAWRLRVTGQRTFALGLFCLGVLAAAFLFVDDSDRWMYQGGFVFFYFISLGLIILASGDTIVSKAMSHPILRRVGFLSYALYLWHWPIRVLITDSWMSLPNSTAGRLAGILLRLTLTFAVAWLSMELIEKWFRNSQFGAIRFGISWLGVGAVVVSLALLAQPSIGSTIPNALDTNKSLNRIRVLETPTNSNQPTLLIVGDSVALTLDNGIRQVIAPTINVVGGSELGCGLLSSPKVLTFDGSWTEEGNECPDHDDYWTQLIAAQRPEVILVLWGAWDLYARDWGNGAVVPGDEEFDNRYRDALDKTLAVLSAEGAEVILLTTPCFAPSPGQSAGPQHDVRRVERLGELQRERASSLNAASGSADVSVVDLQSVTCADGFTSQRDGVSWRPDGVHFSVDGAKVAANWVIANLPASSREVLGMSRE